MLGYHSFSLCWGFFAVFSRSGLILVSHAPLGVGMWLPAQMVGIKWDQKGQCGLIISGGLILSGSVRREVFNDTAECAGGFSLLFSHLSW